MTFLYDGYMEEEKHEISGYTLISGFRYSARTVDLQYTFRIYRDSVLDHSHAEYLPRIEVETHRNRDYELVSSVLIQTNAIGGLTYFQHKEFMEAHEYASEASLFFQEKIDDFIAIKEKWFKEHILSVEKDSFILYPSRYSCYLDMQSDLHNRSLLVIDDGQYLYNLETEKMYKHTFEYFRTVKDMYELGEPIYMEEVDEDIRNEILEALQ